MTVAVWRNQKLIVEYNGNWWHANPNTYKANNFVGVNYGTRAEDVWARDVRRKAALEAVGYRVHVVWEADWNGNPTEQLESIKMKLRQ